MIPALFCMLYSALALWHDSLMGTGALPVVQVVLAALSITALAYYLLLAHRLRQQLSRQLERSDLAARLAAGPELVDAFCAAVPFPWSLIFARRPGSIKGAVTLFCTNAAWFLRPTAVYVRPSWILASLGLIAMLAAFVLAAPAIFPLARTSQTLAQAVYWQGLFMPLVTFGGTLIAVQASLSRSSRRLTAFYLRRAFGLLPDAS
jgi:hypothetical protein